jgi:hypothetical protein
MKMPVSFERRLVWSLGEDIEPFLSAVAQGATEMVVPEFLGRAEYPTKTGRSPDPTSQASPARVRQDDAALFRGRGALSRDALSGPGADHFHRRTSRPNSGKPAKHLPRQP